MSHWLTFLVKPLDYIARYGGEEEEPEKPEEDIKETRNKEESLQFLIESTR